MKRVLFFALFLSAILAGCSSGKRLYQKGKYDEAVYKAVQRLQQKPSHKKAIRTLKAAYPQAINYHMDRVKIAKESGDPLRWEQVFAEFQSLNGLYDAIMRSPAAQKAVKPQRYTTDMEQARQNAAEARYKLGVEFLEKRNKNDAKTAYIHFEKARELMGATYKDVDAKMSESMSWAITNVVVLPVEVHSNALKMSNDYFQNKIMEWLYDNRVSKFVEFYTEEDANSRKIRKDEILDMSFDDFVVGQMVIDRLQRELLKDSVIVGTTKVSLDGKRDTVLNVYGKAKATLFVTKQTVISSGLLDFKIREGRNGTILTQEKLPGTFTWLNQFGYYQGDVKALSEDDLKLTRGREVPPPSPQDLFYEFTKPIFNQIVGKLSNYYSRY